MGEIIVYRQVLLSALNEVVNELSKTVTAIPTRAWHIPLGPDSHTPHYTLAHLRELEARVFVPCLYRIQDEDSPRLPVFNDEAWMARYYQPGETVEAIMQEFAHARSQELTWLRELPTVSWSRTARHPWWGVRTLQWWVELQLDCSKQHVKQLTTFIAV